ncbi:MAG: YigZ family protein [Treponema sp.]|nr:YigZ family protein [Treponema sp.]
MLIVPWEPARTEIRVVNSRFIASLEPVDSAEAARAFIARIRSEFPDASHHVPAYVLGGGKTVTEYCSDDGEPSGTAGRPLLAVLKGSGLGDAAIVVTRYFGGTLLGTGGLVKAYSEAGKAVLGRTRKATLVETGRFELDLPYRLFDRFQALAEGLGGSIAERSFGEDVSLALDLPLSARGDFEAALNSLSSGEVRARLVSERLARVPL